MNYIDLVLLLILAWAAWKGFTRGLIIELASVVSLVLGIYAAVKFSDVAAQLIQRYVDMEGSTLQLISFSLTFFVVVLLVMLVGKILERFINLAMLGWLNRISGAVFSVFKISLMLSILMMLLKVVDMDHKLLGDERKDGSFLYRPIESMGPAVLELAGIRSFLPGHETPKEQEDQESSVQTSLISTLLN